MESLRLVFVVMGGACTEAGVGETSWELQRLKPQSIGDPLTSRASPCVPSCASAVLDWRVLLPDDPVPRETRMSLFDKVFGFRKPNTIEVAFGKERFDVDFLPGSIEDGTVTVGDLRSQCTYITDTPAENIRLLFRGKNLTNDTVKLSSVGMKSGSKCLCMASKSTLPPERAAAVAQAGAAASSKKAQAVKPPIDQLSELLLVIQTELEPPVQKFISEVPSDDKIRKETHDRLAELLLQKLFALDGIVCKEDAGEAEKDALRQKRKEGVKYTQSLLDSVDKVVRESAA